MAAFHLRSGGRVHGRQVYSQSKPAPPVSDSRLPLVLRVLDDFHGTVLGCFLDLGLMLREINAQLHMCRLGAVAELKDRGTRIATWPHMMQPGSIQTLVIAMTVFPSLAWMLILTTAAWVFPISKSVGGWIELDSL
jgi:hypothetical protein